MRARILIVEDEQIIAADIAVKLSRMGHEVVGTAIAGEEAVGMAEELRPDLVLMDIQLEGSIDGLEAARSIEERTGAGIIFVTAFPGAFLRDLAQSRRTEICLSKPFSRLQMEAAVGAALGGRAAGASR